MTVRSHLVVILVLAGGLRTAVAAVTWPTGNTAFMEGKPYKDFVQPTASGEVVSGLFGCVRSGGSQFHEGLDLFPVGRDSRGEATDTVHAVLPGVVRYVNKRAGNSSFGHYVVVEHTGSQPSFLSLYAHLATVDRQIRRGAVVEGGERLGIMGHSAGGYSIPRERAHLHLEFGVWLSRGFPDWYAGQGYEAKNQHGLFNGLNIVGLDFLDFVERRRTGQVGSLLDYVQRLPTAATVIVHTDGTPDFVERYPELLTGIDQGTPTTAWSIDFTWFGLPKAWRPVSGREAPPSGKRLKEVVFHDAELLARFPCHDLVQLSGGRVLPGTRMQQTLSILFSGM